MNDLNATLAADVVIIMYSILLTSIIIILIIIYYYICTYVLYSTLWRNIR